MREAASGRCGPGRDAGWRGGASSEKPKARPGPIEIRCKGGRILKVEANLDPSVLRALIRSVEEA
jgi:hypothetical protein